MVGSYNADTPLSPSISIAFSIAFMTNIQPQVDLKINYKLNRWLVADNIGLSNDADMDTLLGRRIKHRLKALEKTQSWLAGEMKCSDQAVSKWIKGKSDPSYSNLIEMARLLKCSAGYLAGDETNEDVAAISELARKMDGDTRKVYRRSGVGLVEHEEDQGKRSSQ